MNETMRTSIFVAGAVLSLIAARAVGPAVPKSPKEYSHVGEMFYPDFKDADVAVQALVEPGLSVNGIMIADIDRDDLPVLDQHFQRDAVG